MILRLKKSKPLYTKYVYMLSKCTDSGDARALIRGDVYSYSQDLPH